MTATEATAADTDETTAPSAATEPGTTAINPDDEIGWLRAVLGATTTDMVDYLVRPSAGDVRLLLPSEPPAVAASALRRVHDDRGLAERAQAVVGRQIAQLGLLPLVPGDRLRLPRFDLVEHLALALGEPELVAAITLGTRRRNRKPVLQLIRPDGRVVGFAKVGWSPLTNQLVSNEADALQFVESRLPSNVVAPAVLHRQPWLAGEVVVTSPLQPRALGRKTSDDSSVTYATVTAIANTDRKGRQRVGDLELFDRWRTGGVGELVNLDRLRHRHGDTRLDIGLWHGDFTPWNLASRGRSVLLWDWEFAGHGRPVGFDAIHRAFELHRRRSGGTNRNALLVVIDDLADIIAPLRLGLSNSDREALIDLYLCELIGRELMLANQRWDGGGLALLGPDAAQLLNHRLR